MLGIAGNIKEVKRMIKQDTKKWMKAAAIRAAKTMAQSALGVLGGSTMFCQVNVKVVISTSLLAGVCSILTSIKGLPEVE